MNEKNIVKIGAFEYLNIAGAERIHSQMISWLLSKDSPLDKEQKSACLCNLLGKPEHKYSYIDSVTEFNSIDIVIRADFDLVVIENKLKSSQHSNQLIRYKKDLAKLDQRIPILKDSNPPTFYYLTLINERPDSSGWIPITYSNLLNIVKKVDEELNDPVIRAYRYSLESMISVVDEFEQDHRRFKYVFTDGSLKKWEKGDALFSDPSQAYISKCHLETILQKMFLTRIAQELNLNLDEFSIEETHGRALLQIKFHSCSGSIDGNNFAFGIQFQGRSVKLNLHAVDCKKSTIGMIPDHVIEWFSEKSNEGYTRRNLNNKKAYISLSKKLEKDLWDYSFNEVVSIYQMEYERAQKVARDLTSRVYN